MKRSSVLPLAAALLCGAGLSTSQAVAAPVRVVVHLPQPSAPPRVAGYVCVENGVLPVVPPRRDPRREALLLVEAVEPSQPAREATGPDDSHANKNTNKKAATVRIFGMRFQPEILPTSDSAQVVFRNDDRLPVTLVSSEAPRLFPSVPLVPGATLSITVPAGMSTLSVRALEHPQMRSTLLVPKGPWRHLKWSQGGDIGLAELDLPAGVYVARVFFAHHYVASQALSVSAEDASDKSGRPGSAAEATEIILRAATAEAAAGSPSAGASAPSLPDPSPANAGSVE